MKVNGTIINVCPICCHFLLGLLEGITLTLSVLIVKECVAVAYKIYVYHQL